MIAQLAIFRRQLRYLGDELRRERGAHAATIAILLRTENENAALTMALAELQRDITGDVVVSSTAGATKRNTAP